MSLQQRGETIDATMRMLRRIEKGMVNALNAPDVDADAKLTAMVISLTLAAAADLLEKLHAQEAELTSAMQAALISLEDVADAKDVVVMLSAALEGRRV